MPISPSIAATTSATEIAAGRPRQAIAAGGAARRGDQPGMRQRLQQLGDGRLRQPGRGRDRRGGGLPLGMGGQMRARR